MTDDPTPGTTAAVVPVTASPAGITRPAAPLQQIVQAFTEYQQVRNQLLDPKADFQEIGRRSHPKKSAWRKLAVAFNVTCELLAREYERDDAGQIIRAEIVVRAHAPGGRYMDGLGSCDLREKCCHSGRCRNTVRGHTHCDVDDSHDPAQHFSHPQHDIPATAMTRATNRACSDLFGFGEVSAEEIQDAASAPPWQLAGWPSETEFDVWLSDWRAWSRDQDKGLGVAFDQWRATNGIAWPPAYDDRDAVDAWSYDQGRPNPDAPAWSADDERPFTDDVTTAEVIE